MLPAMGLIWVKTFQRRKCSGMVLRLASRCQNVLVKTVFGCGQVSSESLLSLQEPLSQSSLVPFLLPVWLLTQQVSATVRLDGEAALLACQVHTAGRGVTSSTPVHILPQGSVQLQQEEPRGLWGRATLLTVSACSLPEFGWKQPHKVFARMNRPKLIEYLLCARSQPGLACLCCGVWVYQGGSPIC